MKTSRLKREMALKFSISITTYLEHVENKKKILNCKTFENRALKTCYFYKRRELKVRQSWENVIFLSRRSAKVLLTLCLSLVWPWTKFLGRTKNKSYSPLYLVYNHLAFLDNENMTGKIKFCREIKAFSFFQKLSLFNTMYALLKYCSRMMCKNGSEKYNFTIFALIVW